MKAIEEVSKEIDRLARFMRDHQPAARQLTISSAQWRTIEKSDDADLWGFSKRKDSPTMYREFTLRRVDG